MKAVLLAAKASRRLQPLTKKIPKCLIEIGGRTIIEHQLDATDRIDYSRKNFSTVTFIESPEYSSTNTLYSPYLAGDYFFNEDFIYLRL
jgi:choline kinase